MLLLGIGLVLSGVDRLLTTPRTFRDKENALTSALAPLSSVLCDSFSAKVRLTTATAYAVFFAFLSGIIVYQPDLNFSTLYGVNVPSIVVVTCCGSFGRIPQLVFYVTTHLGIVATPLMMTLLFTISWLVGINLAVIANSFRARRTNRRAGLMSGLGGILGVLSACPACAGAFLTTIIGEAGALSIAALSAYQGLFIAASIPLLVVAPVLTTKRASACLLNPCTVL
jgi:MFS family permease